MSADSHRRAHTFLSDAHTDRERDRGRATTHGASRAGALRDRDEDREAVITRQFLELVRRRDPLQTEAEFRQASQIYEAARRLRLPLPADVRDEVTVAFEDEVDADLPDEPLWQAGLRLSQIIRNGGGAYLADVWPPIQNDVLDKAEGIVEEFERYGIPPRLQFVSARDVTDFFRT